MTRCEGCDKVTTDELHTTADDVDLCAECFAAVPPFPPAHEFNANDPAHCDACFKEGEARLRGQ